MVPAVFSRLLILHVDIPFSGGKSGQDVFSGKNRFKILPIGGIYLWYALLYHLRVASAPSGQTSVLVLYKTIIRILCQVQAHNKGIGRADSRPERTVLYKLLPFLLQLQLLYIRHICKNSLYDLLAIRIDNTAHDDADPYLLPISAEGMAYIGGRIPIQRQSAYDALNPLLILIQDHLKGILNLTPVFLLGTISVKLPPHPVHIYNPVSFPSLKLYDAAGHRVIQLA